MERRRYLPAIAAVVCMISACGPAKPPLTPEPDPRDDSTPVAQQKETRKEDTPAAADPPAPASTSIPPNRCTKDRDCVISTFTQCCTCCPSVPHAYARAQLEALEATCNSVRCRGCDECPPGVDPSTYVARCVDTKCVALPE